MSKLATISKSLINEETLEPKYKDHKLGGHYVHHRECHIEPDWLLIYRINLNEVHFVRTGTHSICLGNKTLR